MFTVLSYRNVKRKISFVTKMFGSWIKTRLGIVWKIILKKSFNQNTGIYAILTGLGGNLKISPYYYSCEYNYYEALLI